MSDHHSVSETVSGTVSPSSRSAPASGVQTCMKDAPRDTACRSTSLMASSYCGMVSSGTLRYTPEMRGEGEVGMEERGLMVLRHNSSFLAAYFSSHPHLNYSALLRRNGGKVRAQNARVLQG